MTGVISRRSMMSRLSVVVSMVAGVAMLVIAAVLRRDTGRGGLIWLAGTLAAILIRVPHVLRNRSNTIVDYRKSGGEMWLFLGMFATGVVLPFLDLMTGMFHFADYRLPVWATDIGAVLQIPSLWLFWRSHRDLGRNWSPGLEVREDHGLVTQGIYARIRHPMYAAIWLSSLAQPLLIHNFVAGALVIPAFALMSMLRIPREEAMMRERFGMAYRDYTSHTGRFIPKI